MSFRARSWLGTHTYAHAEFPAARLAAERTQSVSVCLPARNEAATIGAILTSLLHLRGAGVIDQIVVVDDSSDETAAIARQHGVDVFDQEKLMPKLGPVLGKGDAMWRSLPTLTGDVVCFVDADTERFGAHFVCGLLGPLLCGPAEVAFVKGLYRRPFKLGGVTLPEGGGRVTELTARPLLNLFYPDLAGVAQPLAGEIAARRDLLERLPFVTGYGVDIALLIDTYRVAGLDAIAQVDLAERQNAHQSLRELGPMAFSVLRALASRLEREGRLQGPLPTGFLLPGDSEVGPAPEDVVERPPLVTLRAAA